MGLLVGAVLAIAAGFFMPDGMRRMAIIAMVVGVALMFGIPVGAMLCLYKWEFTLRAFITYAGISTLVAGILFNWVSS